MDNTVYYLRSIYRQLQAIRSFVEAGPTPSLSGEVLADNIDWLDCYIDQLERTAAATSATAPTREAEKPAGTV